MLLFFLLARDSFELCGYRKKTSNLKLVKPKHLTLVNISELTHIFSLYTYTEIIKTEGLLP